ncbi:MAG: hypothetical protein WKF73_08505 [Nocardioidaceae bacterium]
MVARQWTADGSALYGDQWVDRPPLLLVIFRLAATLGGDPVTLRILALLFGAATVVAAWWAGRVINGARGARRCRFGGGRDQLQLQARRLRADRGGHRRGLR